MAVILDGSSWHKAFEIFRQALCFGAIGVVGVLCSLGSAVVAGPFFDISSEEIETQSASNRQVTVRPVGIPVSVSDVYTMGFVWITADGNSEALIQNKDGGWRSASKSAIEVNVSPLGDGLNVFDVYVDRGNEEGSLKITTTLSLPKPVVYSRYAEYDFIKEKADLDGLSGSVKWLPKGVTKTSFTPVLGLENLSCGIELILPANNHEHISKKGLEIAQRDDIQTITWFASLSKLIAARGEKNRFQFAMFDYCDELKKSDAPSLVVYPAAAFQQAEIWLPKLTPSVDSMAFFNWNKFPIEQVGSPVVDESSERFPGFASRISQLQSTRVDPLLYGALHGISSYDPLLAKYKDSWVSDESRRSGWSKFKGTRLQPVSLESTEVRSHILENISTAWKQGFTQSVYLDLAMPTRTKLTSRRAFGNSSASDDLNFIPLLHQWAFLRDLAREKTSLGMRGRIVLHSGMVVPRFLSQYVDNVLVGEPLWREFAKKSNGEYAPIYQSLPEPLVRFFWGKRSFGEPILLPLLTTRYNDKLRRQNKSSTPKKRGDRVVLQSETRDLVRFLLASDMQLWASGTDMGVVRDYYEGINWLGGTVGSAYCVVPLKGKRGGALGVRKRGQRAIAFHLYKPVQWDGQKVCQNVDSKIALAAEEIYASDKPIHALVRID